MAFQMARRRPAPQAAIPPKPLVGTEIETRCRKCKATTTHVVVAKVGAKPTRVRCGKCEVEHEYTATRPRRVAATAPRQLPWAEALAQSRGTTNPYSAASTYLVGSRVQHASFGEGIVVRLSSATVCEVLFEERIVKLLMQATPSRFVPPEHREKASPRRARRFG